MTRELFTSWALREAMAQEMRRDDRVILMGEDIAEYGGAFKVTEGLLGEFGSQRVINTPISENGFVGVAVGAALTGLRPIVEIMFMDFVTLAMDQIVNHAAKFHYIYGDGVTVPMVLRLPAGGGRGYGATHSQTLDSWFISVPGLKVVAPWSPADAKGLLTAAILFDFGWFRDQMSGMTTPSSSSSTSCSTPPRGRCPRGSMWSISGRPTACAKATISASSRTPRWSTKR